MMRRLTVSFYPFLYPRFQPKASTLCGAPTEEGTLPLTASLTVVPRDVSLYRSGGLLRPTRALYRGKVGRSSTLRPPDSDVGGATPLAEAVDTVSKGSPVGDTTTATAETNSTPSTSTSKRKRGTASRGKSNSKVHRKRAVIEPDTLPSAFQETVSVGEKKEGNDSSAVGVVEAQSTRDGAASTIPPNTRDNSTAPSPRRRMTRKKKEAPPVASPNNNSNTGASPSPGKVNPTTSSSEEVNVEEYLALIHADEHYVSKSQDSTPTGGSPPSHSDTPATATEADPSLSKKKPSSKKPRASQKRAAPAAKKKTPTAPPLSEVPLPPPLSQGSSRHANIWIKTVEPSREKEVKPVAPMGSEAPRDETTPLPSNDEGEKKSLKTAPTHRITKRPKRNTPRTVPEANPPSPVATTASPVQRKGKPSKTKPLKPHQIIPTPSLSPTKASPFTPPIYYSWRKVDLDRKPTEEELTKERASVTKLCVVADSITCLFQSLPNEHRSGDGKKKNAWGRANSGGSRELEHYINAVDSALIPSSIYSPLHSQPSEISTRPEEDRLDGDDDTEALLDIVQRVLVEDSANNTVNIHVREMEQLIPPPELLPPRAEAVDPAKETGTSSNSKKKKGKGKSLKGQVDNNNNKGTESPEGKILSPLERVVAMQAWRAEALEKARRSQQRQQLKSDFHVITRVRLYEPCRSDIAVVQGFGGGKAVGDVLSTLNRMLRREQDQVDSEVSLLTPLREINLSFDDKGNITTSNGSQVIHSPFVLRPLLSVYATCLPRRQPLLGSRTEEQVFLGAPHPIEEDEPLERESPATSLSASDKAVYQRLKARYVPPMPRYSTLLTVLVEHDTEMQPIELITMAEVASFRKDDPPRKQRPSSASQTKSSRGGNSDTLKKKRKQKKKYQIYCLISDGRRVS